MSINPEEITTVRVDQLSPETITLTSLLAHQVGTDLKQGNIQDLVDLVATAVGAGSGVGFLAESRTDGQTLPDIPTDPSFMLVGVGTFVNVNGYPDVICTEELNALITVTDHWEIGVEIPIVAEVGVQTVTGTAVDNTDPLNPVIDTTSSGVISVVAGTNITVDNTDPLNPIVSSTGGGGGGAVDSVNGLTGVVSLGLEEILTAGDTATDKNIILDGTDPLIQLSNADGTIAQHYAGGSSFSGAGSSYINDEEVYINSGIPYNQTHLYGGQLQLGSVASMTRLYSLYGFQSIKFAKGSSAYHEINYTDPTGTRTHTLQDASGTIAHLSDISTVDASTIGAVVNGSSSATPNDTDLVATVESSVVKKITWTNVKAFLKTYFDTIYTNTSAVASQITTALVGYATQVYTDAKVQNSLSASTTIAPSATSVNIALALKQDDLWDFYTKQGFLFFEDFIGNPATSNFSSYGINTSASGTGAISLPNTTYPNRTNQQGVLQLATGTTATGSAVCRFGDNNNPSIYIGNGVITFETWVNIETLSDATNRYWNSFGFANNSSSNPLNTVTFVYDELGSQYGLSGTGSPNFKCYTRNSGGVTWTTTSIAVTASQWYKLTIVINAGATSIEYFIDGTSVATHTTTLPIALGLTAHIRNVKTVGTTSRNTFVDYIGVKQIYTTPR